MKKVTLHYESCWKTGCLGLFIEGVNKDRVHVATEGRVIAHDLIEHNRVDAIGGIADELEALGALWWIRGALCDISRDKGYSPNPHEAVSTDIYFLATAVMSYGGFDSPVPNTRACLYDDDFNDIIEYGRKGLYHVTDFNSEEYRIMKVYFRDCIHFLRSGYRKAVRRYRRMNQCRVNTLFWNIATEVDMLLNVMEYEGQQIELRYCLTSGYVVGNLLEPYH